MKYYCNQDTKSEIIDSLMNHTMNKKSFLNFKLLQILEATLSWIFFRMMKKTSEFIRVYSFLNNNFRNVNIALINEDSSS